MGWHSTQTFSIPASCSNCCKEGFIKAAAEILISRTGPVAAALLKATPSPATVDAEKSKIALLPVRAAIPVTGGIISSGRQTNAMIGIRCSGKISMSPLQRDTVVFNHDIDFLYRQYFLCILAPASSNIEFIDSFSSKVQPSSRER
jgi:hypothetical protein